MLVNDALPEDLRDHNRVLDKKGVHTLLQQVGRQHPEKYREISFALSQVGQRAAQDQGGMSFGMRHLKRSTVANQTRDRIQAKLGAILANDNLTDQQRNDQIVHAVGSESEAQQKAVLEEAIAGKNPLAMQVLSGSRGKPMNLASLLASDMLYSDHRDEVIPIPVLRSYSEGLTPEEYWAGTYGARRGIIATKFATQEAGFLSKQLNQAGHRLVVMGEDGDDDSPDAPSRGMIVDTDDMDNEGALLARDAGPYKRNTPLTPKILKQLKRIGQDRILVRSPLVGGSPEGGVYARDVGIRENGTLPGRGEQVGLQAAQALSEPISQGQLSAKHSGGVAGQEKAVGGFQYINQLIQTPKKMQGGAAHSTVDGTVQRIEPAPAGGHYVTVGGEKHYVGEGFDLKVKKGDEVEAGDMLSDGIPNPAIITQYKGVGEGRRYFVNEFRKAMAGSGMQGHRRNIELLARGLINHVQLTEETDDNAPDDIVPYSTLEHTYKPREGYERLTPKKALGQYLERPVLHYTIGTKIRPSMLRDFNDFGVQEIPVHRNPPPFVPHMVRGMYQLQHDPDWMTQMYGSGLKKSLLESVARGGTSEERGTSFIPSLATGTDFGEVANRAVIQPKPAYTLPKVPMPEPEPAPAPAGSSFFGGRYKMGMQKRAVEATPTKPEASASSAPSAPTAPPAATPPSDNNIMPPPMTASTPITPPAAPQPPPTAPQPAKSLEEQKLDEWNRISGYQGFKYDDSRPTNNPLIRASRERIQRTKWRSAQEKAYTEKYGPRTPQEIQRRASEMGDAPASPQAEGPVSPVPPPSTPAQSHADQTQAARTPKPIELSRSDMGPTSYLPSSRVKASPPVPWWRSTAPKPPTSATVSLPEPAVPTPPQPPESDTPPKLPEPVDNPNTADVFGTNDATDVPPVAPAPEQTPLPAGSLLDQVYEPAKAVAKGMTQNAVVAGLKATLPQVAPQVAKTGLRRAAGGVASTLLPGVGLAGGAGVLPALGGMTLVNGVTDTMDAVGLLPEFAGGDGLGNFGWDQQAFDQSTTEGSYLGRSWNALQSPVKSLWTLGQGVGELGTAAAQKAYDSVRGR
jgi:hypothetical protein